MFQYSEGLQGITVVQLAVREDNYIYIIHENSSGITAVVDPADAQPVLETTKELGWKIDYIWNTHHHHDHIGGNLTIKERVGCKIVGSAKDAQRIPGIDIKVQEGDTVIFGNTKARVLGLDGHTNGHIGFWLLENNALFSGDTLFSCGCGRIFDGSLQELWQSLQKLRALPAETQVFCAHEYTKDNIIFAKSLWKQDQVFEKFEKEVHIKISKGIPTIPMTIGNEKQINPFLKADRQDVKSLLNAESASAQEVFNLMRKRKDSFN